MAKIVGIDLGTTFSAIAHVNDNEMPELIPNEDGDRLTPSVIFYDEGEFIVGEYAKQNALAEPENTVEFIKREMGKPSTEFAREFGGKQYAPETLSAEILKTLKKDAGAALGEQVTDAVITVPAYFNDPERQATIRAGELAGFNVQRIINEPTAAALAYGKHLSGDTSKVLVFDLGGGTFDVTVLEVDGQEMTILATTGDHRLGGKDWDDKIIVHVAERFEREQGEDPLMDPAAYLDIQTRAVDAKIQLSTLSRATIITNYAGKSDRLQLTQQEFEDMTVNLVERCRSLVDVVLDEITLTPDQIDKVLLVGGSTRMPMIQNMLTEHFGKPPDTSVNPDEAVAVGAAIMGALIQSEATESGRFLGAAPAQTFGIARISDICSHSLGMVVLDKAASELRNSTIIPKNTNIPCDVSRDDYLTTSPNQTEFDIIVLQGGEGLPPRECPVHDAYEVFDIPPRPAGKTRIKVTYKYNASGVIEVEAEDVQSKKVLPIRKKVGEIDWDELESPTPTVTMDVETKDVKSKKVKPTRKKVESSNRMSIEIEVDIVLVIDCSGSMAVDNKLTNAKEALLGFLDEIDDGLPAQVLERYNIDFFDPILRVGLVSFGGAVKIESGLTQDFGALQNAIGNLSADGDTPMAEAIALTKRDLLEELFNDVSVLILLTDGAPNAEYDAAIEEVRDAVRNHVEIITIGVGRDVDRDYLKQMASFGRGNSYFVKESFKLGPTFGKIVDELGALLDLLYPARGASGGTSSGYGGSTSSGYGGGRSSGGTSGGTRSRGTGVSKSSGGTSGGTRSRGTGVSKSSGGTSGIKKG